MTRLDPKKKTQLDVVYKKYTLNIIVKGPANWPIGHMQPMPCFKKRFSQVLRVTKERRRRKKQKP